MKYRLDKYLFTQGLVTSRSQAESYIRLGQVIVNGEPIRKPGTMISDNDTVKLRAEEQYVSRAGLKLASVAQALDINFSGATVLDVGSSTGGFTDYALRHGAEKVVAVDVGTDQLHPSLRSDSRIELHEKTDIRDYVKRWQATKLPAFDVVVMDVSFISLREILPSIATLCSPQTEVISMVKPQFEAGRAQVNKGIIKNDTVRRQILKDFEKWVQGLFMIRDKADSEVAGTKGNRERFYKLRCLQKRS
ncbi:TlyA family RNA methyltransferase [Candidatus Saccharibacteria bacterium]|nr:TlyA family RNA methyltransferase [Candidatus Saccharibacteria bacterium]